MVQNRGVGECYNNLILTATMKWTTEKRKINDLVPYEHNPRQITDKQYKDLETSLKKFDLVEIPAINKDNTIIAGHQRLNVLKLLGRGDEEIDVRVPDKQLNEKELQEYNIRSNKNTAEWDWDKMANSFEVSDLLEWGFDDKELKIEQEVEEDEAPEVSDEPAISKLGEVYQLGRHFLMCGDSTKIEDVEKLMDGKKADMVFTDPPYGVSYADKNNFLNTIDKGNGIQDKIIDDHGTLEQTADMWKLAFSNLRLFIKDGGCYYITGPQGGDLHMMMMMMKESDLPLRHQLIWVKNNHVLGRTDYNYKHEPILYGWVGSHQFYGGGEQRFSVWNFDKPVSSKLHPTMKPIALVANAINNSSKQDDIVLDLFGGSGSTLIACEQTNRTCYMMELSEAYTDVIRKRYAKFIGKEEEWQTIR